MISRRKFFAFAAGLPLAALAVKSVSEAKDDGAFADLVQLDIEAALDRMAMLEYRFAHEVRAVIAVNDGVLRVYS